MVTSLDIWLISLRWIHIMGGITWIGLLYYFNFVQVPAFKEVEAETRTALVPTLVKRALFWFRWSALITVLAGWAFFFSWWAINGYFALGTGIAPPTGTWDIAILAGGFLGTMMLINVWGIIWVHQKRIIAATEAGEVLPDMGIRTKQAVIASRFNTAMSLPMLFFMVTASHLPLM